VVLWTAPRKSYAKLRPPGDPEHHRDDETARRSGSAIERRLSTRYFDRWRTGAFPEPYVLQSKSPCLWIEVRSAWKASLMRGKPTLNLKTNIVLQFKKLPKLRQVDVFESLTEFSGSREHRTSIQISRPFSLRRPLPVPSVSNLNSRLSYLIPNMYVRQRKRYRTSKKIRRTSNQIIQD
jgi:hypothetical protein